MCDDGMMMMMMMMMTMITKRPVPSQTRANKRSNISTSPVLPASHIIYPPKPLQSDNSAIVFPQIVSGCVIRCPFRFGLFYIRERRLKFGYVTAVLTIER